MKQNQKSLDDKESYFRQWGIDGINAFIKVLEESPEHGFDLNWANKYIKMFKNAKEAL